MWFSQSLQANHNATTVVINSASTTLSKDRDLKRLVQKFKKSSDTRRFRTKTAVYEDTVRRLASAKRFGLIEEILEHQKKYPDYSKEGFAVRLISLYGKSGMLENARNVFDEMPTRNIHRTVLSFNALLAACVNAKRPDLAAALFRDLPTELGLDPDLVSHNTLIKALCDSGDLDSAAAAISGIEAENLTPDAISFNTVLNALYSAGGRFDDGDALWARMEEKGLAPDVRSYNARLYGMVLGRRTGEAAGLVEEMRGRGVEPDEFSFNAVIGGFVREDDLEGARRWLGEMKRSGGSGGTRPTRATFEKLIPFFRRRGDLEAALELAREAVERKVVVETAALQRVVDDLVGAAKVDKAAALVQLGTNNNYRRYRLKLPSTNE